MALERMKENREQRRKQENQGERDAIYAQMLQDCEKTRTAVRNSISKASTISDEDH